MTQTFQKEVRKCAVKEIKSVRKFLMFDQSSEEACKMQEDNNAFETSIDSGISIDITSPNAEEKAENKMKTYQQILFALERDKLLRAEQRKRLR